jgi:acyl-CoA synthetase (AMP-forming)/AMP-acid ligase II
LLELFPAIEDQFPQGRDTQEGFVGHFVGWAGLGLAADQEVLIHQGIRQRLEAHPVPGEEVFRAGDLTLGRAFRPGAVHVVAELPKTRSQKIMRRVIRNLYAGQPPGDLTALDNPAALGAVSAVAPG